MHQSDIRFYQEKTNDSCLDTGGGVKRHLGDRTLIHKGATGYKLGAHFQLCKESEK